MGNSSRINYCKGRTLVGYSGYSALGAMCAQLMVLESHFSPAASPEKMGLKSLPATAVASAIDL